MRPQGALALALLVFWMAPAQAEPRIRGVRLEGVPASLQRALRAEVNTLLDQPATDESLADMVDRLGAAAEDLSWDVRLTRTDGQGETTEVVFSAEPASHRVASVGLTTRLEGALDTEESWRLLRQAQSEGRPLRTVVGRRPHAFLLRLDELTIRNVWSKRGHRDVVVRSESIPVRGGTGLVDVAFRLVPGPVFTVGKVGVEGLPGPSEADLELQTRLSTRGGEDALFVRESLETDAERLRAGTCQRGYARARVSMVTRDDPSMPRVDVTFKVTPGPAHIVGSVTFNGDPLPASVRGDLELRPGAPWCPDALERTRRRILQWMQDHGHPDASVELAASPKGGAGPEGAATRVDVMVGVQSRGTVSLERVWFEGNRVTREAVMRQLLTVREGDLYRQNEIDTSVQNLLRSGLFREAEARTLTGTGASGRFVVFTVVEQDPVAVDVLGQSLTLRNLDLTHWPEDIGQLSSGSALRGAGQDLTFLGRPDFLGLRFENRFLHEWLLLEAEVARRERAFGPVTESWFTTELGVGVKGLQNRLALVPFVAFERSDLPNRTGFADLPVKTGVALTLDVGAEARAELNVRDTERIPYLGLDTTVRFARAAGGLGTDVDRDLLDAAAAVNLPLGENDVGAHYILRVTGRFAQVFAKGGVPAHDRVTPTVRGYDTSAIAIPFKPSKGGDPDDAGLIGGERAASATAEVRIPIRPLRRNAFGPFIDAASVAGEGESIFDRLNVAAGVIYSFSFFAERLEGFTWLAYPFESETSAKYFGAGVGGSF